MNKLPGIVKVITRSETILLLDLAIEDHPMSALLIESPFSENWIKEGNAVTVAFKETEVSLMKNFSGKLSLRNLLPCRVTFIDKGVIMGCVHLQFKSYHLVSAITTRSIETMDLNPGDQVIAMIKANEVSLVKEF
ncbi:MAG TPA: TOBE domain-containing protein [Bacteroidales bacterium]|nr:TOBE domain-containing protein [Bacteroidales bacterium]